MNDTAPAIRKTNAVAAAAAQQNAMERGCIFLPHGSRLFTLDKGWESTVIRREAGTAVCETLLQLEAALRKPSARRIFVPAGALMSEADIERLCQRNGIAKAIFREVGAE